MKIIISKSALPLSLYRRFVKGWDKGKYADLFSKYSGDRNSYRIYLPINSAPKLTTVQVPVDIGKAVSDKGYQIDDYINGIAVDSSGKRRIKIGKLLSTDLQQKFANDKQRQGARNLAVGGLCVISRHPYDVAGMSTGRGWTSCMNLIGGSNKHFVPAEVKEGSLIAYLVGKDDKNIQKPSARILMRVYESEDGKRGLFPSSIYGQASFEFSATVSKWCAEINRDYFNIPYGTSLKLLANLYEDDGANVRVVKKHDPEADASNFAHRFASNGEAYASHGLVDFIKAYTTSQLNLLFSKLPDDSLGKLLNVITRASGVHDLGLDALGKASMYKAAIDYFGMKAQALGEIKCDIAIAAVSYLAYPDSPIAKPDLKYVASLGDRDVQNLYLNLLDNDDYVNNHVLTMYKEVGLTDKAFAEYLFEEANADWSILAIPDALVKPLQKLAKEEGAVLSPSLYGVLTPEDLRKQYKEMYDGYVRDSRLRGRSFGFVFNLNKAATDAYILKTDPTKFKLLWRGDSILPAMVLPVNKSIQSPNFHEYTKQVGETFNKFLAVDAKRDWDWTTQLVIASVVDTMCRVCTKQFLSAIDPKYYSTTLFQAFAAQMQQSDTLNHPAYADAAAFIKSSPELFALFAPVSLGLTDELQKLVLQALFKKQAFAVICLRNSAALEKAKPTMHQARVVGFWPVVESIAVNEEDSDVLYKLKDLGLPSTYLPFIRQLESLML